MKNNKRKSFLIKTLLSFVVLVVVIIAFNNFILPWFVSSPEEIVPNLVGKTYENAVAELDSVNLKQL